MRNIADALQWIALTLWVGGMWAIGFLAAPTLFAHVSDRALAGVVAGKLFTVMSYVGLACGLYIVLYRLSRYGSASLRQLIFWVLLLMIALMIAGEFAVQPILATLKAKALPHDVMESVFRDRFSTWHGIASVLYVIESILGVAVVLLIARGRSG